MFCLFLGLSLSFLTAQAVNRRLQCWRFTAAVRESLAILAKSYTLNGAPEQCTAP